MLESLLPILLSLCLQHPQWNCEIEAMRAAHLKNYVIAPTLLKLAEYDERMNSESANILMMGIAAQESDLWYNLVQLGGGPALGGNGIEPATHADTWRYLNRSDKWALREIVLGLVPDEAVTIDSDGNYSVDDNQLIGNMPYNTAIARIRLWYVPESLPPPDDIEAIGGYYKRFYNSSGGAGTVDGFVKKYNRLVADK